MADRPFILGIVGDFGGRRTPRRLVRVDRDAFDAVMARLDVTAELGAAVAVAFTALEDFHPDALVRRVPGLAALHAERAVPPDAVAPAVGPPAAPVPRPPPKVGSVLDAILAGAEGPAAGGGLSPALAEFVRQAVEPSLVRGTPAAAARWRAEVDRLLGEAVRTILHHPRVRALEAAWRGLFEVVSRAETGSELEIRLLDAPRDAAARLLAEETATPGAPALAAVVAAYSFGSDEAALAALAALAQAAATAGAPLVADADPALLGLADACELGTADVRGRLGGGPGVEGWRRFRAGPLARHVVLCLPRVLLRVPYGLGGEEVTSFAFDEGVPVDDHAGHLWGSAALAFGRVLVRGFAADGWGFEPLAYGRLERLPLHAGRVDGEERVLPCAEVVMSDATIRAVAEQGLVPLASVRDRDEARFVFVGTVAGSSLPIG
jgi:type VI secretion system protein ImpC